MKGWDDQIYFCSVMAVADHKKKLIALANIITKAVPI